MSRPPVPGPTASRMLVFGFIAMFLGFVLLMIGVPGRTDERSLARKGLVAHGTVTEKRIDHVTRRRKGAGADEQTLYIVRYRFPIGSNAWQDGEQAVREAAWRAFRQDGTIAIRYLDTNPSMNRVDTEPATDVSLVIGAMVSGCGLILAIAGARKARQGTNTSERRRQ